MNQQDSIERLLDRARESVEGLEANQALWNAKQAIIDQYGHVVSCELIIDQSSDSPWSEMLEQRMPSVRRFLDSKGVSDVPGPAVLLTAWWGERLYLFEGGRFFRAVADISGLTIDELNQRLRGEQPASAPLFLPPAEES